MEIICWYKCKIRRFKYVFRNIMKPLLYDQLWHRKNYLCCCLLKRKNFICTRTSALEHNGITIIFSIIIINNNISLLLIINLLELLLFSKKIKNSNQFY